jgi:hypothetical protein
MYIRLIIFVIFSGILSSYTLVSHPDTETRKLDVLESISSEELMSYVYELVDPRYKGRLAGSPEYMDAAAWVADIFKKWGIEPMGDEGSYFQIFPWPYSDVYSKGSFTLHSGDASYEFFAPADYYPGANSTNGKIKADVVFVGYGISAPELGYDDFDGTDVMGKIVMIAPGTPYTGNNPDTLNLWGSYSGSIYKTNNARLKGASGVLFLDKLANPGVPYFDDFYYVHVDAHVSEKILGKSLKDILDEIRKNKLPQSFITNFKAEIKSETQYYPEGITANVVGFIPGSDPELKKEAIILGAHLDGQGFPGFLFPGALDNASGVADVMAVARALSEFKGEMKRSVVFIMFGAEEVGLVGSTFYCENPAYGPEQTVLFMNLDMVGNGTGLALWHGESYPELYSHFARNNDQYIQRSLRSSEGRMTVGRPRTDGAVFMQHGFRTFHVSTTDRVNPLYYHDERDVPANLVPDIMRDVSRLLFLGVMDISNDENLVIEDLFLIR